METEYIDGVGLVEWRVMEYRPGQFFLEVTPQEERWAEEKHGEMVAPILRIPLESDEIEQVEAAKRAVPEGLEEILSSS